MVAPSLVMVTSPILSTSILSRLDVTIARQYAPSFDQKEPTDPTGPRDDLRIFETV